MSPVLRHLSSVEIKNAESRESKWRDSSTSVYIRDDAFSWLPAKLVSVNRGASPPTAKVVITLPSDWDETTSKSYLSPKPFSSRTDNGTKRRKSTLPPLDVYAAARAGLELTVDLSTYPGRTLPSANLDQNGQPLRKNDIADLPFLHEAAVLYNVKDRHARGVPYTRVNDIILAMNPFQWFSSLYSQENQVLYANHLIWNAPLDDESKVDDCSYGKGGVDPHVYETSALAYRGLVLDKQNQAILVSGESGAGKTETVKIVMSHLAMIQSMDSNGREGVSNANYGTECVVGKLLESNSIFEAFGNAKTVRNDNSSRFGKFTQLQFDSDSVNVPGMKVSLPGCHLVGSNSETYLLEKSRVVAHNANERTYHIFYQLLAAPKEERYRIWDGLVDVDKSTFKYVYHTETHMCVTEESLSEDANKWCDTVRDLEMFGIKDEEFKTLMRALCVVMQLGNLTFGPDAQDDERAVVTSPGELLKLSVLMGIDFDDIAKSLTTRSISARSEAFQVYLNETASKESCDALAKEMYSRIFDRIVRTINECLNAAGNATSPDSEERNNNYLTISLLDLFGFETFDVNRFEQLCINYANEKLQQKYVMDNFSLVKNEYEAEGIDLFDLSMVDNKDILDMLEGGLGILATLNDECVRPNGNESSFIYKVKTLHRDSGFLVEKKLHRPFEFGVQHFAGPVTYDARKIIERNNDKLELDLVGCASKCTNHIIRSEFQNCLSGSKVGPRRGGRSFSTGNTVAAKFRSQLTKMMAKIQGTRTRYIRCIRPNKEKIPRVTDHSMTMKQLRSAGIVMAITISRETFPDRMGYELVLDRFKCLVPRVEQSFSTVEQSTEHLLETMLGGFVIEVRAGHYRPIYVCGKTKVYFRPGALEHLESDRVRFYGTHATRIQSLFRCLMAKWKYSALRKATILLQARLHAKMERTAYLRIQQLAVLLQCWARLISARKRLCLLRLHHHATVIQRRYRGWKSFLMMDRWRKSALLIQQWIRKAKDNSILTLSLAAFVEMARQNHRAEKLMLNLADFRNRNVSPELNGLAKESQSILEYYRAELFKLRMANGTLRSEVISLKDDRKKLSTIQNSFDAALTSSQRRIMELGRTNESLMVELVDKKRELGALHRDLTHEEMKYEDEIDELRCNYEDELADRDAELAEMRKEIQNMQRSHEKKMRQEEKEKAKARRAHEEEVCGLQEELEGKQEEHHDYIAKLMNVLEAAQATRESDALKMKAEHELIVTTKDDEIAKLKRQVDALQRKNKTLEQGSNFAMAN